jgi:hypothetical protein
MGHQRGAYPAGDILDDAGTLLILFRHVKSYLGFSEIGCGVGHPLLNVLDHGQLLGGGLGMALVHQLGLAGLDAHEPGVVKGTVQLVLHLRPGGLRPGHALGADVQAPGHIGCVHGLKAVAVCRGCPGGPGFNGLQETTGNSAGGHIRATVLGLDVDLAAWVFRQVSQDPDIVVQAARLIFIQDRRIVLNRIRHHVPLSASALASSGW